MVIKSSNAQGLMQLCSNEQLKLLNIVDSLRSQGVNHYISLPQIIVCGDQSAGKSSVLQSISGVSFPVNATLCTRFPTELILRNTPHASISISIVPHHSRIKSERDGLLEFHETLEDFNGLPDLIQKAKAAMGVMDMCHAFSEDILRVEVNGPDRPHLTIVDLPGVIHSENKHQSASDIELINSVVKRYMREPRSIILAVVSAKNDYANQVVLKLAQTADPKGKRTLGVITKPDTIAPGAETERSFLSLAKNQEVGFHLGWHVLRNQDTERENWTSKERDAYESNFLSSGAWASLPPANRGIQSLRDRLSKVLVRHVASELPKLIKEIDDLSSQCQKSLDKLGVPRATAHEQKEYLIQTSQTFQTLLQAAIDGTFNSPCFSDALSSKAYQTRLRAVVQNLSGDFARNIKAHGRHYKIEDNVEKNAARRKNVLTRDEYIDKIVCKIRTNRGTELPGLFNPMIVAELFQELASPWEHIAEQHIETVWKAACQSLECLITHVADSATGKAIFTGIFQPSLNALLRTLHAKLSELLKPHQNGHPITYGGDFKATIEKIRKDRQESQVGTVLAEAFGEFSLTSTTHVSRSIDFCSLRQRLVNQPGQDMDHSAAANALDFLEAYYLIALSRFIDDVAVQVVETCLLNQLREIMDPMSVFRMDEEKLARIAGETEESRKAREELQSTFKALKNGSNVCSNFAAPFVNALDVENDAIDGGENDNGLLKNTGSEKFAAERLAAETEAESDGPAMNELTPETEKLSIEGEVASEPLADMDDEWAFAVPAQSKRDKKKKKKPSLQYTELAEEKW